MPSHNFVLFIGHSHINCISDAIEATGLDLSARAINLKSLTKDKRLGNKDVVALLLEATKDLEPAAICLSIGGNTHNLLGLIEHPEPFSLGEATHGVVPAPLEDRHFIPHALIKDFFVRRARAELIGLIYGAFANARRLYLNAPPPISDWDHIRTHPHAFADKLHLGPPPDPLRLQLYNLQTEVLCEISAQNAAIFVEPDQSLKDARGFLLPAYYKNNPTHGNVAYGQVMLKTVMGLAEGVS